MSSEIVWATVGGPGGIQWVMGAAALALWVLSQFGMPKNIVELNVLDVTQVNGRQVITHITGGELLMVVREEWDQAVVTTTIPYLDVFAVDSPVGKQGGNWTLSIVSRRKRAFKRTQTGDLFDLPYALRPRDRITLYFSSEQDCLTVFRWLARRMSAL